MNPPKRRHEITIRLSADSVEVAAAALRELSFKWRSGSAISDSVSGGYSTGWVVEHEENLDMTHDKWAAELEEYLKELDEHEKEVSDANR